MDSRRSYIDPTALGDQVGVMPDSLTGQLQKYLYNGEYLLFKRAPVFESDFIQITKKGQVINIHHHVSIVTIGLTSTNPDLQLPDVMLLARPSEQPAAWELSSQSSALSSDPLFGKSSARYLWSSSASSPTNSWCSETARSQPSPSDTDFTPRHHLELKGLLPLKLVKLSIFHKQKHRLKVTLASGRSFYLQLYVQPDCEQEVFEQWVKVVHLLKEEAHSKHSPSKEPAGPQRSTPHSKIPKGSHRERGCPQRDEWECGDWMKDPKGGNILNVLTEKSLWEGSEEEGLISRQGSWTQLPVTVTCRYSPNDARPPFTTYIDSGVFYLEEPEPLTQDHTSPADQRQGDGEGVTGTDWTVSDNPQNLPQETLKKGKEKRKEKDGRKKGKNAPAQDEKYSKEQTTIKRTRPKDMADLMTKSCVSEEQRRAEIILWMKKAEEEEKKHREQKKV
ncbi:uncharacterized protein LOC109915577 isoform X2 [Rhincodon typus]|uniref:uncharacterized protein LOC109915577 isoform X2 n=1 Tax=Rhincodon typus TaxID=259920 RepID=UPI00202FBD65|nr:uncharacterized protein LOC109915577 isoform X2 [Rhincodon typus]